MARLSVAVRPPPEVMALLSALDRPALPGVRWSLPEQWLVKLRPLGQVDERIVPALRDALGAELDGAPAVACRLGPVTRRLGGQWLGAPVHGLDDLAAVVFEATRAGPGHPPPALPGRPGAGQGPGAHGAGRPPRGRVVDGPLSLPGRRPLGAGDAAVRGPGQLPVGGSGLGLTGRPGAQDGVREPAHHLQPAAGEVAVEAVAALEDHEPVRRQLGPHGLAVWSLEGAAPGLAEPGPGPAAPHGTRTAAPRRQPSSPGPGRPCGRRCRASARVRVGPAGWSRSPDQPPRSRGPRASIDPGQVRMVGDWSAGPSRTPRGRRGCAARRRPRPAQAVADQQVDRAPEAAGGAVDQGVHAERLGRPRPVAVAGQVEGVDHPAREARAGPTRHQVAAVDMIPWSRTTRPRAVPSGSQRWFRWPPGGPGAGAR